MCERLEQYHGRSSPRGWQLESLISSSIYRFVDGVVRSVRAEVVVHRARVMGVVISAFDSLELDRPSLLELLCMAERGGRVVTASPETSGTPSSVRVVPGKHLLASQS